MKKLSVLLGAVGLVLTHSLAAHAAKLSLAGRVELSTSQAPVGDARITVTFHGHEVGIHEYTTQRTIRAYTDELGNFLAEVKVPDRRYTWTHATVEISETSVSKQAEIQSACWADSTGISRCDKSFHVNPISAP
ncbi:MAG: hypothetical protein F6J95_012245 [Leptolyngbya sp. SIO1E4]|nr:hypothetical protein [Leptolyngbya sp. SIO1E4]